jgi:hypothetical protein
MSTSVAAATWITKIADEERQRDAARAIEDETIARKADLVRRAGRRIADELRAAVTRDVQSYRGEFPGDAARDIVVEPAGADGGFIVRKPAPSAASLTVTPKPGAAIACHYRFSLPHGLPPLDDHIEVNWVDDGGETLQMKHGMTGQLFPTADALSEFLLVPALTGRPRASREVRS